MVKKKEPAKTQLQILWNVPPFMASGWATNVVVQGFQGNFKISFFELKPDIALTPEQLKKIEERGTINADCIGSYILSPDEVEKLIRVLQDQYSKYLESQKESKS